VLADTNEGTAITETFEGERRSDEMDRVIKSSPRDARRDAAALKNNKPGGSIIMIARP